MRFKQAQQLPKELLNELLNCESLRQLEPISAETILSVERHVSAIYQVRIFFKKHQALYWVKFHSNKNGSGQQEYEFLSNAYDQFLNLPGLNVIKPVAYLREYDALVTEHSNGEPLSEYVKYGMNIFSLLGASRDSVKHNFYMCGELLAKLHEQQLPINQCYMWDELFEYIDVRLKRLVIESDLNIVFYNRVISYFEAKKKELSGINLVRVKTHGDYAPYNILVSDNELVMFDPAVGQYFGSLDNFCSQYEDVVHFYKWSLEMFTPFVSQRIRNELVSIFIEGYNNNSKLPVNTKSLEFEVFFLKYKLLSVFDTWPSVISKLSNRKGRVKAFEEWFDKVTK